LTASSLRRSDVFLGRLGSHCHVDGVRTVDKDIALDRTNVARIGINGSLLGVDHDVEISR